MTYCALTPRAELRLALHAGWSMERAEMFNRRGSFSDAALARFHRIWAWSTATEHPVTRGVPLARWSARRERIRRAVRSILAPAPTEYAVHWTDEAGNARRVERRTLADANIAALHCGGTVEPLL